VFFLLCKGWVYAQSETDIQLAQHYFLNNEFSKAQVYYEKLYNSDPSKVFFNRYLDCFVNLKDTKGAEKLFKKHLSLHPDDVFLALQFYFFYTSNGETEKAKKIKQDLQKKKFYDAKLFEDFIAQLIKRKEFEWAKQSIEAMQKTIQNYPFELLLGELHKAQGDLAQALNQWLKGLAKFPNFKEKVQQDIGASFDFTEESEDLALIQQSFVLASQEDPENPVYTEMLIWFFLQNRNFDAAYQQVVSYEKRFLGDGYYLLEFGKTCLENEDFPLASSAFKQVIDEGYNRLKEAERWLLKTYFLQITKARKFTPKEMEEVIQAYEKVLNMTPNVNLRSDMLLEFTEILGFYAGKANQAIALLEKQFESAGLTDINKAKAKMKLADLYVLVDRIWDASIYYMQLDEAFKFEAIGNEAKFKNARVFYFDAEFDYAQAQLDVLKQATSKLISNDAMQLSLMLLENYGLDSNYEAMSAYAKCDLLITQHKFAEAFIGLDSILINFPEAELSDEIFFLKGNAYESQGDWPMAITLYGELVSKDANSILADDALYRMGSIAQMQLKNSEEAQPHFMALIDKYPASIFLEEASQAIRKLRGDKAVN
jgi:tetratricopeptide (TPR) repeat protein